MKNASASVPVLATFGEVLAEYIVVCNIICLNEARVLKSPDLSLIVKRARELEMALNLFVEGKVLV
jgi:hypothetical protein